MQPSIYRGITSFARFCALAKSPVSGWFRTPLAGNPLTGPLNILTLYPDTEWNWILRVAYSSADREDARRSFLPPHSPHGAVFPVSLRRFRIPSRMKRLSVPAIGASCAYGGGAAPVAEARAGRAEPDGHRPRQAPDLTRKGRARSFGRAAGQSV